jgi:hypothetical protein
MTGVPPPSKCCILYIFSTNINTEYFKHAAQSPFFSSKCHLFRNATFFGSCIIHILTCICLRRRFFRVTSRTTCNIRDVTPGTLTATDTCIGYHVTRFEASQSFSKPYPSYALRKHMCGGAGCGRGRGTKKKQKQSAVAHVIIVSCYKYGRYRHRCC